MNKLTKKLAAAGLCLVLSAGMLTGCGNGNAGKTIATLNGQKTEYAVANIMLRYNQAQMQTYYGAYMGDSMWTQYGDTTKTSMMSTLKQMLILEAHMDEYEVSLTDEEKAAISEAAAQFMSDNEKKVLDAMGATQERVERVLTLYTIQTKMSTAMVADVDTNVTDEEAAQKTIEYAFFSTADTTDDDGNTVTMTDEEKSILLDQAETLVQSVENGADMSDALAAIDEDKSVSTVSYGENDEDSSLDEAVVTAANELKDGEVADVVTTDSGYYVVKMVTTFDEEATEQEKEDIISERKSDRFTELYEAWEAEADYTEDADLLEKMTFTDTYEMYLETETETEAVEETAAAEETTAETAAETVAETEAETAAE